MMSKIRVENKQNSALNGVWAGHVDAVMKKITSGLRRAKQKQYVHAVTKGQYDPTSIDCRYMML